MAGSPLQTGMSLGPYHLVQCLASEGGAEVYQAQARYPDGAVREVALKVLLGTLGSDPDVFAHLVRAMEPALACRHDSVVRTLELRTVDQVMVVAMELVDGVDLGNLLASLAGQQQKLSVGIALHVAARLLEGLDHFHSLRDRDGRAMSVVHGNLHPGNVLLSSRGQVKIADFILSLIVDASPDADSDTRERLYRSPEQATGDAVDHRTDIFAVGLLLYEALVGRPAYDAEELEDPTELEDVICEADIIPVDEQVPGLPPELVRVVGQALEPESSRRFASARQMLAALAPLSGLPEVAAAGGSLAQLVSQVGPRVRAARRLAMAARALEAQEAIEGDRPDYVPGLPPPVVSPARLDLPDVPAADALTPPAPRPRLDLPSPLEAPRAPAARPEADTDEQPVVAIAEAPAESRGRAEADTDEQPPVEVMAAGEQQQSWDTAVLDQPAQPQPEDAPPEPTPPDRKTAIMEAAEAAVAHDSTGFLEHTALVQMLQQKDQQRTVAGKEQVRECTLFWSCEDEPFVVAPDSSTQLFAWSPDGGIAEVELTPHQQTAPTLIKQQTQTRRSQGSSKRSMAVALVVAGLLGLGGGAAVSRLLGTRDAPGHAQTLRTGAAPLVAGSWSLSLPEAAVQRQENGALRLALRLTHGQGRRPGAGRFFAAAGGARPDFWTVRPAGDRSVEVVLVFSEAGPAPPVLRFAPPGIAPVTLRLEGQGIKK